MGLIEPQICNSSTEDPHQWSWQVLLRSYCADNATTDFAKVNMGTLRTDSIGWSLSFSILWRYYFLLAVRMVGSFLMNKLCIPFSSAARSSGWAWCNCRPLYLLSQCPLDTPVCSINSPVESALFTILSPLSSFAVVLFSGYHQTDRQRCLRRSISFCCLKIVSDIWVIKHWSVVCCRLGRACKPSPCQAHLRTKQGQHWRCLCTLVGVSQSCTHRPIWTTARKWCSSTSSRCLHYQTSPYWSGAFWAIRLSHFVLKHTVDK